MKNRDDTKALSRMSEDQFIILCQYVGGKFNSSHYKLREVRKSLDGLRKDTRLKFILWSAFKEEIRRRLKARTIKNEAAAKSLLTWGHDFKERF